MNKLIMCPTCTVVHQKNDLQNRYRSLGLGNPKLKSKSAKVEKEFDDMAILRKKRTWFVASLITAAAVATFIFSSIEPAHAYPPDGCWPAFYVAKEGVGSTCAQAKNNLKAKIAQHIGMDCPDGECGGHAVLISQPCYWDGSQYRIEGYAFYSCEIW